MSGSFAFRQLWIYRISAAAVLALALSACGGGGNGGPVAELAAAPASKGGAGAASADGDSAAAGAPPRAGAGGGGSLPVEERLSVEPGAEDPEPGVPVNEGAGEGAPAAPGGGSTSPSAAVWHVFGETGTGPNGAALVTAGDLAGISTVSLVRAGSAGPSNGSYGARRDLPNLSQSDAWMARGTRESMAVRVGHNAAGQTSYSLAYEEGNVGLDETDPDPEFTWTTTYQWTLDSEAAGTNVRRWSSGGRQGAMFRRETDAGNLWAAVATDISGPGDTDWLATGVWAYAPAGGPQGPRRSEWGGDDARGYRFGVFADGGDPFRVSSRAARTLAGRATYEGAAAGVYSRLTGRTEATRRNDLFSADATLTIDFVANGRDTAAGRIHNFAIDGTPIAGNPEITLSKGRVYVLSGGVINADEGASMTFDGASWDGDWGAALFGNPASGATGADRLPGSVAGAFGVGNGNVWQNTGDIFIGAFGAHRTE